MKAIPALLSIAALTTAAHSANVLIVSAGSVTTDNALVAGLTAQGHTADIGPNYWEFDTSVDLSPYDVVYIQGNGNWTQSDMPIDAQTMILDFAQQGAGVVFSEWVVWMVQARNVFQVLAASMPVEPTTTFRTTSTITFNENVNDPFVSPGLPTSFTMPLSSFSGTETFLTPKENATVFYDSDWVIGDQTGGAVVGWDICGGRVVNFSTVNGINQINDPNFQILLGNLMEWVSRSEEDNSCPVDIATPCGTLNFFDVSAYLARFSAQDLRADLTGDALLNFFDISEFLSIYSSGCP
ncbi:MAG: GC-type dockerin domain-anchored protein [Phycisphaerales bacterium]